MLDSANNTEHCRRLDTLKSHVKMLFSCFGNGKAQNTTNTTPSTSTTKSRRRRPKRPTRQRSKTELPATTSITTTTTSSSEFVERDRGDETRRMMMMGREREKERVKRKVVVVGDGECGKTCLLQRFCRDAFMLQGYLPTVFDTDVVDVELENVMVELMLTDTAGQEDYDRLRPYSYRDADAVLVCFSIDNPASLDNVRQVWASEVRHHLGNKVPILLVGNKSDLRHQGEHSSPESSVLDLSDFPECSSPSATLIKQGPVKESSGQRLAEEVGALGYWETSALLDQGVRDVFLAATSAALYGGTDPKVSGSSRGRRRKKDGGRLGRGWLLGRLGMKKSRQG